MSQLHPLYASATGGKCSPSCSDNFYLKKHTLIPNMMSPRAILSIITKDNHPTPRQVTLLSKLVWIMPVLKTPQTGAKQSQRQRNLRCEFCRGMERTRRQVAVPTLARKNRAGDCETAAIYSLSLLARFFVAVAAIVQVSHSNSESCRQLAIRMSFVGRFRRVGPDRFHY